MCNDDWNIEHRRWSEKDVSSIGGQKKNVWCQEEIICKFYIFFLGKRAKKFVGNKFLNVLLIGGINKWCHVLWGLGYVVYFDQLLFACTWESLLKYFFVELCSCVPQVERQVNNLFQDPRKFFFPRNFRKLLKTDV